MKIYALYFSPTGGTKRVLDILISAWDCEKIYIDLSNKFDSDSNISFDTNDVCVIASPTFSGRVPQFILPKLRKLSGGGTKALLITSYGNRAFDDSLLELKDTMEACGFICICAVAAVTQHSVLPRYGKGRPDSFDVKELRQFSVQCKKAIDQEKTSIAVSGNRPYRKYQSIPIKPKANKLCTGCGICYQNCPVHAIHADNYRECDIGKCISCLQCVSICPQKARNVNPMVLKLAEMKMRKVCGGRKTNQLFVPEFNDQSITITEEGS